MDAASHHDRMELLRHKPMMIMPVVTAITAMGPLSLNIIVPALPALALTFHADNGTAQLLLSLYLFGMAVSQLVVGTLSDRFGRRPVMIAGLAISVVTTAGALLATNLAALIFVRVLQSFGASSGMVLGRAIIRDLYSRERAASMIAGVTTVTIVAPLVGPVLGGVLDTVFGWQAIFAFLTVVGAVLLAWVVLALPETRMVDAGMETFSGLVQNIKALFRTRAFIGYLVTLPLGTVPVFTFLGGAPHVVVSIMHRSSAEYGLWSAGLGVAFLLGSAGATRLIGRLGLERTMALGLLSMAGGAIAGLASEMLFADAGPIVIFGPQVFTSFGNGLFMPTAIAGAVSVRPQVAGTASGLCGFAQMGLAGVCAQIVGMLLEGASNAWPMTLMILVLTFAALVSYVTLLRSPRA